MVHPGQVLLEQQLSCSCVRCTEDWSSSSSSCRLQLHLLMERRLQQELPAAAGSFGCSRCWSLSLWRSYSRSNCSNSSRCFIRGGERHSRFIRRRQESLQPLGLAPPTGGSSSHCCSSRQLQQLAVPRVPE